MKKFMLVAMVLTMASLASAVPAPLLQISVNGVVDLQEPIVLRPSDILKIDIHASGVQTPSMIGWMLVIGPDADVDAGRAIVWEQSSANNMAKDLLPDYIAGLADLGYKGVTDIIEWDIKDTVEPFSVIPNGVVIDNIMFHCTGYPGTVTLMLTDLDLNVFDTVTIKQIPEPMTMALLGLGGLFIRRR